MILDHNGKPLDLDPNTGELLDSVTTLAAPVEIGDGTCKVTNKPNWQNIRPTQQSRSLDNAIPKAQEYVQITTSVTTKMWDAAEAKKCKSKTLTTGISDSFTQMCKKHKIPFEHHEAYREWMVETQKSPDNSKLQFTDLPAQRMKLRPGIIMPWPSGSKWRKLKAKFAEAEENEASGKIRYAKCG